MNTLIPILVSFLVVYFSTPLFKNLALKLNILDVPDDRKTHKNSIPLLGGVAIYIGVISGLLFSLADFRLLFGILIGGIIILIIGLIDDIRGLSVKIRLLGQLIAALVIIGFGMRISFLPNNLWGDAGEVILTLIWVVGITNALNYLDGIDGLAAGTTAMSALCFSIISYLTNQPQICLIALILMAGCLGFLPYNFKQAKIFLGDAGSTFIGFMLAGISVVGDWASDNVVRLAIPILILGVPIFDMIFTTIMRIKEKKISTLLEWLSYGDRDHFHHRLVNLGLRPIGAVFFIYFVTLALGISAIIISYAKETFEGVLAILQAAIIFEAIAVLMVVGGRHRSGWNIPD
ncbi:MAG: undecaprenyl/decaprenyl-phosphate alpha-N-acetylglucosaminyl 1-phosphate transferase [Nitrospirae bacterium]|nr:undecaprenyl/decaprenyl-phosphate alpha-N-acetylglucosaminyl 1-phosphate transferase [Nitrospirota bacterium]